MLDPPMTAIERGIRYVMNSNNELQSNILRPQCWKCGGSGRLIVKESNKQSAECSSIDDKGMLKYYKACRICVHEMNVPEPACTNGRISVFKNYAQTGPTTPGNVADKNYQPRLGETLCSLSGHYMIYQYTRGHRFTTDDVCTAYFAYTETKHPSMGLDGRDSATADKPPSRRSHLDLGCGLGSVLLMLKWKYGEEIYKTVGVEAQHANLALARRSIAFNGLQDVCDIKQGDMKEFSEGSFNRVDDIENSGKVHLDIGEAGGGSTNSKIIESNKYFDIVTGTPPYFPLVNGALPQDAGRGQCAFECRGGIETYLAACARNLSHAASARCVLCQTYLEVSRTEASAEENRLLILKRLDVYGKVGQSNPLFCVFSMRKMTEEDGVGDGGDRNNELDTRKMLLITTDLDSTTECRNLAYDTESAGIDGRHVGNSSVAGYTVIPLYVRKLCGCHTAEYDIVMEEMGRPKSSCNCLLKQLAAD